MRDIHCPKDIGFENTFSGEDCEKEQHYNNCYHCWSTAIASRDHQLKNAINKIREIVDEWQSDTWTDNLSYECMAKIAKLVEPQEREEV